MTRHIRVVRAIAGVLALLQLLYFTLSWILPDATQVGPVAVTFTPRGLEAGAVAALAPGLRWSGTLCALPALLLLAYAFLRLDRMLQACAGGRMFALATVGHMKAFAASLLGALVLTVLEPALRAGVWRLLAGGPGHARPVNVGVSSEELMLVLICALFFVVASMMHEARRIAEDNEGFV